MAFSKNRSGIGSGVHFEVKTRASDLQLRSQLLKMRIVIFSVFDMGKWISGS